MSDETASQPQIKIAWLIGTLAAFALFAVIAAYSKRMTRDYPDYDQQRAQERYVTLGKLQHDEQALISPVNPQDPNGPPTAEWVDQAKGTVRIPIEEAMVKEIDALKTRPVAMGAVIPVTPPPAPAKPAAGGTNAGPAKPSAPGSTNAAPATMSAPASTNAAPSAPASTNAAPVTPPPAKPKKSNK